MKEHNIVLIGESKHGKFAEFLEINGVSYAMCPDYRKMVPLFRKNCENYAVFCTELTDDEYILALRDISLYAGKAHLVTIVSHTPTGVVFGDPRRTKSTRTFNYNAFLDGLYQCLIV